MLEPSRRVLRPRPCPPAKLRPTRALRPPMVGKFGFMWSLEPGVGAMSSAAPALATPGGRAAACALANPVRARRRAARPCLAASARAERSKDAGTSAQTSSQSAPGLLTMAELGEVAARRGVQLRVQSWGPLFRITFTERGRDVELGLITGFTVPLLGLVHFENMLVFNSRMRGKGEMRRNALGLGFLVGAAGIVYGHERGCTKAEILAINDDPTQFRKLVRYYERFGWEPVREVTGDTLADLPHMVVWGGAGMRMDADIGRMMRRWSRAVALSAATGNMPTQPLEPEEC